MDDNYQVGEMVKVSLRKYNEEHFTHHHGMILQVRNKSRIAYVEFLPLENRSSQWVTFEIMRRV